MRYIAVLRTLTLSQMASRVLRKASIPCEVVKAKSGTGSEGCSWGVAFDEKRIYDVKMALSAAGIFEQSIERE